MKRIFNVFLLIVIIGLNVYQVYCKEKENYILKNNIYVSSNSVKGVPPSIILNKISDSELEISVAMQSFSISDFKENGVKYNNISFKDKCFMDKKGYPDIPLIRKWILGKIENINIKIKYIEYDEFDNINIPPSPGEISEKENLKNIIRKFNTQIYEKDEFFPENWVKVKSYAVLHGIEMSLIEINAIKYNPLQKKARIAKRLVFSITTGEKKSIKIPEKLNPVYKGLSLNYSEKKAVQSLNAEGEVDYLIIADSSLSSAYTLQSLINYHKLCGKNVKLVSAQSIGGTADQIKSFIQEIYNSADPPQLDYVLFVGDIDIIPFKKDAYTYYKSDDLVHCDSDIWYGWLDGDDMISDVGIGRFPAEKIEELNTMISKTLNFSWNKYSGSWQNRTLLVANKEDYPEKYTECKENISRFDYKIKKPEMVKLYGGDPVELYSNYELKKAVENGCLILNYRGHGKPTYFKSWNLQNENYTVEDAAELRCGNMTPVVFSIACHNSDLRIEEDCLGEAFMKNRQGAVAFLGANMTSTTTVNSTFDEDLFYGAFNNGIENIGDLVNYGNAEILRVHGDYSKKNITIYSIMGDPALSLYPESKIEKFSFSVNKTGQGSVFCTPQGENQYEGAVVRIYAKPHAGWWFGGFNDLPDTTTNIKYVTVFSDTSVSVKFIPKNHIVIENESNNTYITANGPVISGVKVSGSIQPDDTEDWFFMDMDSAGIATVALMSAGGEDLDCYVYYKSDIDSLVYKCYSKENPDVGRFNINKPGRYYFKVTSYKKVSSDYSLLIQGGIGSLNEAPEVLDNPQKPIPKEFVIRYCYPNPFNNEVSVSFDLKKEENVDLIVYNILGQPVKYIMRNEKCKPGNYIRIWKGDDNNGNNLSSGVYMFLFKAGSYIEVVKAMYAK